MPQRKLQVLAPAQRLSPAFKIPRAFYDRPGAAGFVLDGNLSRLAELPECQQTIIRILRDPLTSTILQINSNLKAGFPSPEDALLHGAFKMAVMELFARNRERIQQALQIDTSTLPAEHERQHAANLYAAGANATWQEIGEARATYHATEWLLAHAASTTNGREPISISQALIEASVGLVPTPQPELTEAYQRWGSLVLANLPDAGDCLD